MAIGVKEIEKIVWLPSSFTVACLSLTEDASSILATDGHLQYFVARGPQGWAAPNVLVGFTSEPSDFVADFDLSRSNFATITQGSREPRLLFGMQGKTESAVTFHQPRQETLSPLFTFLANIDEQTFRVTLDVVGLLKNRRSMRTPQFITLEAWDGDFQQFAPACQYVLLEDHSAAASPYTKVLRDVLTSHSQAA